MEKEEFSEFNFSIMYYSFQREKKIPNYSRNKQRACGNFNKIFKVYIYISLTHSRINFCQTTAENLTQNGQNPRQIKNAHSL